MTRRARPIAVFALLAAGALGVIAGTQTWVQVELTDGAMAVLAVPGTSAAPVWTPLSLALLAVGATLSIAGPILRYVSGTLALIIAAGMSVTVWPVITGPPVDAVVATVAETTGISGAAAVSGLVATMTLSAWSFTAASVAVISALASALVLTTARDWPDPARRYRNPADAESSVSADPVDSWDALSRGNDPTGSDTAR